MNSSDPQSIDALARSRIQHAAEYYDLLKYEIDPLGGYRLSRDQRLPHVSINKQGYRGRDFATSETILLLGDSVTFGVGASSDDRCFARFLEKETGQTVADASVRAYRTFQHFSQLPRLFALLPELRVVLVWIGYADLLYWATTGGCLDGAFQFERKYGVSPSATSLLGRFAAAVLSRFNSANEDRACERGTIEELAAHVSTYVRAIGQICTAEGTQAKVLIQPFVRSRPLDPDLRRITDHYSARTEAKCGRSWYDLAERYILSLCKELTRIEGMEHVDLQPHFSEGDFLDQVHLREESLQSVARVVGELATKETTV